MQHNTILAYLAEVDTAVKLLKDYHIEKYEEEFLTSKRINLRIRIRFSKGNLLEINEALIEDESIIKHLSYRYHFQDKMNNLIFRYDNTPHFQGFINFPHHKHLPSKVLDLHKPSIIEVVKEVILYFAES